MAYNPIIVELTDEDKKLIHDLATKQTQLYGHDRGYFKLGRSDSSHEIGFEGEVAFVRWAHDTLGLEIDKEVGLNEFGAKYDAYIIIDGRKYNIHIKTGRWTHWPQESYYFGVHYGQEIENSGAPVVLMSYLKDDDSHIKIEGFMTSKKLSQCRIIKRGEFFPGMSYPSRTDNWLTKIGNYETINNLIKHLKEDC